MFDSSVARGQPAQFAVNGVIKGWTEGLQLMVVGEKRRMWIPAALAYGEKPRMGAPVGDLVFDVELLEVIEGPKPPDTPTDLAKPPADAKKTKSGLVYRVLTPGKGDRHPKETDRVRVHYSGWTKDGNMFDSSVTRGRPATFPLNGVIKGWTEGVQLMKQGDKFRFWIPADLAYGATATRPGAPSGDLVFDVELIDIL
jgi:peptidylprolyl isomerase